MDVATDVQNEILAWIREKRGASERGPREIKPDTNILAEGILDSLGILNLVNWIEERYALRIADSEFDMDNFRTIDTIADFVEQRRSVASKA
jgi:acyl carrier protein